MSFTIRDELIARATGALIARDMRTGATNHVDGADVDLIVDAVTVALGDILDEPVAWAKLAQIPVTDARRWAKEISEEMS